MGSLVFSLEKRTILLTARFSEQIYDFLLIGNIMYQRTEFNSMAEFFAAGTIFFDKETGKIQKDLVANHAETVIIIWFILYYIEEIAAFQRKKSSEILAANP